MTWCDGSRSVSRQACSGDGGTHKVEKGFVRFESPDVLGDHGIASARQRIGPRGRVRRCIDVRQRMEGLARGWGSIVASVWVAIPDVEERACDDAVRQSPVEGVLIDDLRSRDVDK